MDPTKTTFMLRDTTACLCMLQTGNCSILLLGVLPHFSQCGILMPAYAMLTCQVRAKDATLTP